jgi:hypothetical protein
MTNATPPAEQPGGSTSESAPPRDKGKTAYEKLKQRVELAGAIVIGIAAVLTAIATVQGGDADAAVAKENTTGIADTLIANGYFNDANAQRLVERDWIFSFMSEAANDAPAADIILYAMPDDVFVLADAWLTANEIDFENPQGELIDDPFSGDYAAVDGLLSAQLEDLGNLWDQLASCAFFSASVAGVQGDSYGLSTVFLAIAIVVGGIAALVTRKLAQIILLTTAVLSLALGAVELSSAGDNTNSRAVAAADFFVNDDGTPMIETDDLGVPLDIGAALAVADATCPDTAQ